MSLEKQKTLHSVEILIGQGAVQAAWHTVIKENGKVISGPSIHRAAYKVTDASVLPAEVLAHLSVETLAELIEHCRNEVEDDLQHH